MVLYCGECLVEGIYTPLSGPGVNVANMRSWVPRLRAREPTAVAPAVVGFKYSNFSLAASFGGPSFPSLFFRPSRYLTSVDAVERRVEWVRMGTSSRHWSRLKFKLQVPSNGVVTFPIVHVVYLMYIYACVSFFFFFVPVPFFFVRVTLIG